MNHQEKLDAAVEWLGTRWVFHPARHIQKGDYKPQEIHTSNVAETFKREWARLAQQSTIILEAK